MRHTYTEAEVRDIIYKVSGAIEGGIAAVQHDLGRGGDPEQAAESLVIRRSDIAELPCVQFRREEQESTT
jgi:hypothetical protein